VGKGTSTTWYIGAWVVWVVSLFAFSIAYRFAGMTGDFWLRDPNLTAIATIIQVSMLVMCVAWIGALVRLARIRRWGWFAGVLLTQLAGAGILGMVMYAGVGPEEGAMSRSGAA
jgi:hypothetical protein